MFDYVIIGAGSAGCVLANKLSADPGVRVCLLEAGGDNNSAIVRTPGAFGFFMFSRKYNWAFNARPDPAVRKGSPVFLPRGKGLGGSSATNGMVYIRGHRRDYDEWAALGNPGWGYDEVLPYFKRSEDNARGADAWHGAGGPLRVSDAELQYPISRAFIEAAREAGLPSTDDFNGEQQEGIGAYQFTIRDGTRCGVAAAYLDPAKDRANLTIVTGALVSAIDIADRRATGVTYVARGERHTIPAAREVILCAGTYGSPQLLMLSGVGDPEELARHGIETRHSLPGVGRNLLDHADSCVMTTSRDHGGVGLGPRGVLRMAGEIVKYATGGRGLLRASATEMGGFLRTGPEHEIPDVQFHGVPVLFDDSGRDLGLLARTGYSMHVCVLRPRSQGRVTLAGADPGTAPVIDCRALTHPEDVKSLVAGIRIARRWLAAPALARYRKEEIAPGPAAQSDAEIEQACRDHLGVVYHPVGTCRMGRDEMAVVDATLKLHGIAGLRIVDASVMPTLIGGNTNAPTIMIAEKAADMIHSTHSR